MVGRWSCVNLMTTTCAAVVLGCSAPSPPVSHVSSPAPDGPRVSLTPLTASSLTEHMAPAQSLVVALPEAALWQVRDEGTYFHAVHPETSSELWVRRWRQGQLVNSDECAAQSALWRPDLVRPNGPQVETQRRDDVIDAPPTYRTAVNVRWWAEDEVWNAQLTASGAAIRECFTYVYRTRAPRSPLGRAVLEQRLNVMRSALASTRITGVTVNAVRLTTP